MEAVLRHLVILAHPGTVSFNRSVVETYIAAVKELGHQAACRDLYTMNFNPVLSARDITALARGTLPRDIGTELNAIRKADVVALVSPLWWRGFPAMLKGYVDRVFTAGCGYLSNGGDGRSNLSGRKGILITTAESSTDELRRSGALRALMTDHRQMLKYCGIELMGELYLDKIAATMSRAKGERLLGTVRRFVHHAFS
jgi:NAD(P)H dehydrogenase (quinone)